MRYTTVIDISEFPNVYRNDHAKSIYLHMVLKCGYHDDDRDRISISIRNLAWATGNTLSATRHALKVLQEAGLIVRTGDVWAVRKWCSPPPPTPRTNANTAKTGSEDSKIGKKFDEQIEEYRQKVYAAIRASTREELIEWLQELENGISRNHKGAYIKPNRENVEWLRNVINQM